jgi:hypothetical protein
MSSQYSSMVADSLITGSGKPNPAKPRFYMDKELSEFESAKAGQQIWRDVEMVEIIVPGDNKNVWAGRVKAEHRERWPDWYKAFKEGLEPPQDGYPLKEWPLLSPAQVANFAALNIQTVEALAALPDGALQHLGMGGFQIRDKAQKWLAVQADSSALNAALAERDAANAERDDLRKRVEAMERRFTALLERDAGPAPASGAEPQA